ncbi:MAG: DUF1186 domain-containing protein [Lamprocystis purpurea]|uniref:DUF1186 domain-containing protein n=1 Tax=Lamprocystis purpurea TaxID=61598 RepID=UPI00037AF1EA|nr:DUF1186 domain-containing protein [Lamprocystis purpurea]MBV5272880.1 DUF1186 domain-containing protein [Lamprocystis purpurea]
MTPDEIFEALATAGPGRFPRTALIEAVEQQQAVTPLLLDELRRQIDAEFAPAIATNGYWRHHFAIYLLAYFREPAAYPLFVQMGALPGETLFDAIGDTVAENFGCQLAAVCHGDTRGIERLIEDPTLNEYVRTAALSALEILFAIGELDRDALQNRLGRFATRWLDAAEAEEEPSDATAWVWATLVWLAARIDAQELVPLIDRAFELQLVDDSLDGGAERFERVMAEHRNRPKPYEPSHEVRLPGHPVEELERWYCFQAPTQRIPKNSDRRPVVPQVPAPARAATKVGRNEPCPCGSGKKYKKCCGN